jgi:hypothetical protein
VWGCSIFCLSRPRGCHQACQVCDFNPIPDTYPLSSEVHGYTKPNPLFSPLRNGASMLGLNMPECTHFGVDQHAFSVGPKFMGLKMVPPGAHFISYRAVNKEDGRFVLLMHKLFLHIALNSCCVAGLCAFSLQPNCLVTPFHDIGSSPIS